MMTNFYPVDSNVAIVLTIKDRFCALKKKKKKKKKKILNL
jgi:hypothetical protein